MALINCPECNKQISDKATNCPHCGFPLALRNSANESNNEITSIPNDYENAESAPLENNEDGNSTEDKGINSVNTKKSVNGFIKKRISIFNKEIPLAAVLGGVVLVVLIFVLIIVFIPKGSNTNNSSSNKSITSQSGSSKPTATTKPTSKPTATSGSSTSGSTRIKTAKYLSDRSVQYNEEDNDYIVFFGLKDENEEYISSKGTASIVITDKTGNELYNKDISFSDNDFSSWSNKLNPTPRFLCGLHIKTSDISGAASSSGTLSLAVELDDGVSFESSNLSINNLKEKELSIALPELPQSFSNYNYKNEIEEVIEVTDIEVETTVHYNGSASVKLYLTVSMLENYSSSTSHYSHIGYKLKDSNGVIVDSGNASINPMAVGETSKDTIYINNLDANESYTLELDNSKR